MKSTHMLKHRGNLRSANQMSARCSRSCRKKHCFSARSLTTRGHTNIPKISTCCDGMLVIFTDYSQNVKEPSLSLDLWLCTRLVKYPHVSLFSQFLSPEVKTAAQEECAAKRKDFKTPHRKACNSFPQNMQRLSIFDATKLRTSCVSHNYRQCK